MFKQTQKRRLRERKRLQKKLTSQLIAAAMSFTYLVSIKRTAARAYASSDQSTLLAASKATDACACDCRSGNC
jgi:hypothetical protein